MPEKIKNTDPISRATKVYTELLKRAIAADPKTYHLYHGENPRLSADKIGQSFIQELAKGTPISLNTPAFKAAAKALGIQNTRKGWKDFLNQKPTEQQPVNAPVDPKLLERYKADVETFIPVFLNAPFGVSAQRLSKPVEPISLRAFAQLMNKKWPDFTIKIKSPTEVIINRPKSMTKQAVVIVLKQGLGK
jgi:hypothetical protein